jgi:hypothetical protein
MTTPPYVYKSQNAAFAKYNTPSPQINIKKIIDSPLLPKEGVPITEDDFVDSTDRIVQSTNTNELRYGGDSNILNLNPVQFYNDSGPDYNVKSREYNLGQFPKYLENPQYLKQSHDEQTKVEDKKINELNRLSATSALEQNSGGANNLTNLSLYQILINTKDAWFYLLDDLLEQRFEIETFTKNNRLFYIGLTLIFFASILYIYVLLASDSETPPETAKRNESINYIYNVYPNPNVSVPITTVPVNPMPVNPMPVNSMPVNPILVNPMPVNPISANPINK